MSGYPQVESIKKVGAMAGQITYQAKVKYPHEPVYTILFHGESKGQGPVVMQHQNSLGNDTQTFVTDPSRFGVFGPEWVRRFFNEEA